jgi:two-component system, OmpR family, alkaline phosphatase synthesis response regulator PhoP
MNNQISDEGAILLVEDEDSIAAGLEFNLTIEGFSVKRAKDGLEAIDFFYTGEFDLVILDIMLPYKDGFEVAEKIRETAPQTPILMLTARTKVEDRIRGLEVGADDYMVKPFNLQELMARVKGMLRRKAWYRKVTQDNPIFSFGKTRVNFKTLQCRTAKTTLTLTQREAMLLKYLVDHEGEIVSRKELLEQVWHITADVDTRTVDNFVARLRKYFEPDPKHPVFITSVRSAGYKFQSEASKDGD